MYEGERMTFAGAKTCGDEAAQSIASSGVRVEIERMTFAAKRSGGEGAQSNIASNGMRQIIWECCFPHPVTGDNER